MSFSVAEGGFRWLLGPSGAGKSSLLRLLYLAQRPTVGRVFVLGARDWGGATPGFTAAAPANRRCLSGFPPDAAFVRVRQRRPAAALGRAAGRADSGRRAR
ncbi:MAG: ATP-binding cassette domain-containing protein [Acetobacteraceae bacterium]